MEQHHLSQEVLSQEQAVVVAEEHSQEQILRL
jgi:hypothetical protein